MVKRRDPLTTFLFGFKITSGDLALDYKDGTAFFRSVSGLKVQQDVQDYNEGGVSAFTRKIVSQFKWPNIVLSNGFTGDPKIWNFMNKPTRVNAEIVALGHNLKPVCRWEFYNGYPVKWSSSDFDATKNEVAIETIEFTHEGLVMNPEPATPPAPPPEPPPAPPEPPVNANVNFATNSKTVPSPNAGLDAVADSVKKKPDKKVKIEGHTDNVGAHAYNMQLSQERADAVKQYLLGRGVTDAQIASCTGYGPDQPIADNSTAAGRAQNRRTTVTDAG
jgi:OOP family OmpA-OmpF porin